MKTASFAIGLLLAVVEIKGCMTDAACADGPESQCCYMNECWPSSSIGCQGDRINFFRHL